ncbi:hypothetical protein FRB99_006795 [Tulasnella sp. 403]|nr:hypothetical protein FRB99_006795 [Tulasnella sp. 403]
MIQLFVKTHKTTIVIATLVSNTIGNVKQDVFSALQQFEGHDENIPAITGLGEFEICRTRETGKFVIISTSGDAAHTTVKDVGLKAWERLFLRFRDANGNLEEVKVDIPPMTTEGEDDA